MIDRSKYLCPIPFRFSEITNDGQFLCCPGWLPIDVKKTDNYLTNFNSKLSQEIRESILDGSYKFCKEDLCPHLASYNNGNLPPLFVPSQAELFKKPVLKGINFGFDISCNLGCPSCRSEFINFVGENRIKMDKILDNIINQVGDTLERIVLCGGAEPFFSKTMLRFMREFDPTKFPNLKHIHLHTNATLWNKNSWNLIKPIHDYVHSCHISMDAGSEEVYKVVRKGGNWKSLMKNIDFILSLNQIKYMKFSFVTQQRNYKDMINFYNLIHEKMKNKNKNFKILFAAIVKWGEFMSQNTFEQHEIQNKNHKEHELFLNELKKVHRKPNVEHAFDNLLQTSTLI